MSNETLVIVCLIIGNFLFNAVLYQLYHNDFKRLASKLGRRKFALLVLAFGWVLLVLALSIPLQSRVRRYYVSNTL